ncbi:FtsX-like permease family protein [Aliiroseovarius sp.]|uniref:ABC transporter permease n=1 Tax=Aliiroseovarius sp. TaxID=1872442 RepID=UPI002624D00F|nr:FtsX-like permease family protein [Aliiroseovarius sp.]
MLNWTFRELISAPQQLLASVAAVAGAFALVLFFEGVFAGESDQIVALIERTEGDVWVMQKGVGNMHMATSFVSDWKIDAVADVDGVEKVTPILYLNSAIEAGGRNWFSFVVGLEPGDGRAGPWRHAGGAQLPGAGTAIVPDIFASDAGLSIGDTVRIAGRDFAVAGFSGDTFSMANSITFVTIDDLADTMSSIGTVSYMLVDAAPGVDPAILANRIMGEVEKVNALTRAEFAARDYSIAVQMGLEIVWMMTLIGGALAMLLTGFIVHSHISERERELAVMKALGVRNSAIYGSTMLQALAIGALAFLLAVALMLLAIPLTQWLMPKVSLAMTGEALIRTGSTALVVSLVASVIPVRRVLSVDPVTAFQQ